MQSVPQLMAMSYGICLSGNHACFYCGALADESLAVSHHVKDSFTERGIVACPGSNWICKGCELCLREDAELTMLDGSTRRVAKCAMRAFSWLISDTARAGSKADITMWRELCLNPPAPPFAIVLSDSGQKHLLYRGVVCWSQTDVSVTLEAARIDYQPASLADAISLCSRLIAATGKPALDEPISARFAQAVSDYYSEWEALLNQWETIYGQPIARLAAWLSPGRDAARELWKPTADNGLSGFPKKTGRTGGPGKKDRSNRESGSQGNSNTPLFDLC
jgi:CRISPR type IV-associated protein Csf1